MMGVGDVVDSGADWGDGAPVGVVSPSKSPLPSAAAALARFQFLNYPISLETTVSPAQFTELFKRK
jgi:hypothetical protein